MKIKDFFTREIVKLLGSVFGDLKGLPPELAAVDELVHGDVELKHLAFTQALLGDVRVSC